MSTHVKILMTITILKFILAIVGIWFFIKAMRNCEDRSRKRREKPVRPEDLDE